MANTKITTNVIADDAITTAKIADDAVTTAKIADDAVGNDQLASGLTLGGNTTATIATAAQPNITSLGTLTSLTVDDITINGSTISDGGNLTLDAAGDIHLDADSEVIRIRHDGGDIGMLQMTSNDLILRSMVADKDLIFKGNDGGSVITALTLDMSEAGAATFNAGVTVSGNVGIGNARTDGTLHVLTASAGTVSASTQADDLVIENNAEGGMTIITPDDESARIRFTSPSTNTDVGGASIFYRQNINKMNIGTNVAGGILALHSGAASETMRLDASGNVGVGVTPDTFSSGYKAIQINGYAYNIGHSGGDHYLTNNAYINSGWKYGQTSTAQLIQLASGKITLYTAASGSADSAISWNTGLVQDSVGKVGIGETSPFSKFHVKDTSWSSGSGSPYGTVQLIEGKFVNDQNWGHLVITDEETGSGQGGSIRFATGPDSNLNPFAGIQGVAEGTSYGGLGLYTRPNGGTATERVRIDSDGGVTMTRADNGAVLSLKSTDNDANRGPVMDFFRDASDGVNATNDKIGTIRFLGNDTVGSSNVYFEMQAVVNDATNGSEDGYLDFFGLHNGTQTRCMIIGGSGGSRVYVGPSVANMYGNLNVANDGCSIGWADDQGYYRRIYAHTNSSSMELRFWNGVNEGRLTTSGVWTDASDVNLKKDIVDIEYGLETVKKLKPRKYKMKSNDEEQIGFIAQEVETEIPEVVGGGENPDGVIQKNLSYGQLTAVLTKAMQEQQELIETLQTKVAALENK